MTRDYFKYEKVHIDYFKKISPNMKLNEIVECFNKKFRSNLSKSAISSVIYRHNIKPGIKKPKKLKSIYAIYDGDEFLTEGTAKEIADKLGIKPDTIYFYASSTYSKRMVDKPNARIAIKIDYL